MSILKMWCSYSSLTGFPEEQKTGKERKNLQEDNDQEVSTTKEKCESSHRKFTLSAEHHK